MNVRLAGMQKEDEVRARIGLHAYAGRPCGRVELAR